MSEFTTTRRRIAGLAGGAIAATALAGTLATPAAAEQGNMEAALGALSSALNSLHRATPNKGGHKERAVQLIEQAIAEVQAGIVFADEHGGG